MKENQILYLYLHKNTITSMKPPRVNSSKYCYHCLQHQTEIISFLFIYQLLLSTNHSAKYFSHNVYILLSCLLEPMRIPLMGQQSPTLLTDPSTTSLPLALYFVLSIYPSTDAFSQQII